MPQKALYSNNTCLFRIILLFGITVRIIALILYPEQPRDSYYYKEVLDNWKLDLIMVNWHRINPPMYFCASKIISKCFQCDTIKSGISLSFSCGLFSIIVFEHIINEFKIKKISNYFLVLIFVTHPKLIAISTQALRESLYLLLVLLSTYTLVRFWKTNQCRYIIYNALFICLAIATRIEAIELIITSAIVISFKKKKSLFEFVFFNCLHITTILIFMICISILLVNIFK